MSRILRQLQWCAAALAILLVAWWQHTTLAGQRAPDSTAVRTLAAGQPVGGDPGKKGTTYYALEGQTTRLTTSFVDGSKAVAERTFDGDITTTLADAQGNEINHFKIDRVDGVHDVLHYRPLGGAPVLAQADPAVRQTLDWSNHQSHRLYQDRVTSGTRLQWKGGMMRAPATAPASDGDNDREVRALETQWTNGLAARTVRIQSKRGTTYNGKPVNGDILWTTLTRDGVELGTAQYLTYERIFRWVIPGLSEGAIGGDQLKTRYGGWRFTPDMTWMNLQTIATFHWRTLLKEKGTVARQQAPRNPILQFFMPALAANDEGCDSLHWLDGTIFRACCDVHDQCYENNGCTSSTWWRWGSWKCDFCNAFVVVCFVVGGSGHIRHPYGGF
jgi:hypothetical protein